MMRCIDMDQKKSYVNSKSLFSIKKEIIGEWVAVMDHERHNRHLILLPCRTRCVVQGHIHEFLVCNPLADTSLPINCVSYLGFGELLCGGVIEVGDLFYSENELIGCIAGFDETHFPNHYNIVIKGENLATGATRGLSLKNTFSICKSPHSHL